MNFLSLEMTFVASRMFNLHSQQVIRVITGVNNPFWFHLLMHSVAETFESRLHTLLFEQNHQGSVQSRLVRD